jgi:phenylalanyl-tRNA synthetase beta chain
MRVSVAWLRELVDVKMPVEELAHALTMAGLEVEEATPVAAAFSGIVVAHVKSVAPHPNADKLRVTEVDAGTGETLTIVCGAPNVAAGQKVPCALVGAKLPSSRSGTSDQTVLEIRKAKLRGVESSGMLCSARELGLSEDHAGLLVLEADAPVGRDIREHLALDDVYLTLKLTPNRGDCLSMFGVARDVAAITGAQLRLPEAVPVAASIADLRPIRLTEGKACSRYTGRIVRGLDLHAATPAWMVRRLERAGLRSISPLVDITNYVMLERGQPMHAFDDARLKGGIDVRFMKSRERLQLLNEQWIEFLPGLLAIADESGPVALGGVMGGRDSMVGEGTTDVFFESAFFDPEVIQGKARALDLTSDAAYRFERGVDFAGARAALERATALALEICGGSAGPVTEATGQLPARPAITVRPERVRRLLGYEVSDAEMIRALERVAGAVHREGAALRVAPPSWRFDLAIEEDFVEEVARLLDYGKVPSAPPRASVPMLAPQDARRDRYFLRHRAADLGYQEIINYSFVPEAWEDDFAGNGAPVRLANPIAATMGVMRSSLVGGLVATLASNLNRGETQVRLVEIGRCFEDQSADLAVQPERIAGLAYGTRVPEQWAEKSGNADFFDIKGDLESLAAPVRLDFEAAPHAALHPGRSARVLRDGHAIGFVGELHPRLQQKYELPLAPVVFEVLAAPLLEGVAPRFSGVSRMPVVRRDLAVTVPDGLPAGSLLAALRPSLPAFVRELEVFDQYRGKGVEPGRKSLAFRIVMQDTDRTLTDSEVEAVVASLREQLIEQFQAKPRT